MQNDDFKPTHEMTDAELAEHEAGMEAARARLSEMFAGTEVTTDGLHDESRCFYNPDGSWHDEMTGQDFDASGDLIEEYDDDDEDEGEE